MDPQTDLPDLVEDLEVNIDELSTALEPLLAKPLHTTASSLPLLDKAKLYVLAAYSIEALLFSALKASGVNATEHAVFKEIARLKGYNSKIKEIEERGIKGSAEGRARLDVGAAQRFIKHGLAGNDRYDLERQERMAKERARAHLKAQQINKKFDDEGKEVESEGVTPKKRTVDEVDGQDKENEEDEEEDEEVLGGLEDAEPTTKKARVEAGESMDIDSEPVSSSQSSAKKEKKAKKTKTKKEVKKAEQKSKQSAESTDADAGNKGKDVVDLSVAAGETEEEPVVDTPPQQPKKRGRPPKKDKKKANQSADTADTEAQEQTEEAEATPSGLEARVTRKRNRRLSARDGDDEVNEEAVVPTPDRVRKTRSETFNALLDGSLQEKQEKQKKGKASGRGRGKPKGKGK
jgi:exosome complex protein LRP1